MVVKSRKRKAESGKGKVEVVDAVTLDPELIDPCPFQPRTTFPEGEIRELADSIAAVGQITPVIVRRKGQCEIRAVEAKAAEGQITPVIVRRKGKSGKRYELVDGERRLRAVKLLGSQRLPTIRAEVQPHTDAQVRAVVLTAAIQRKDLSPIEEARAFRVAIDAGDAAGPTELAGQTGLSQGHVSNRLRLLQLPKKWLDRVARGELPATHAREVLRIKDHPAMLKELEKHDIIENGISTWNVQELAESVDYAIETASKPMEGGAYEWKLGEQVAVFTPTADEEKRLKIIELDIGNGKVERRATNLKLWSKLQEKHVREMVEKSGKGKAESGKGKGKSGKGEKGKKLTAAQRRKLAERVRQRKAEAVKLFEKRLAAWRIGWLKYLIADLLKEAGDEDLLRVLVMAAGVWADPGTQVRSHGETNRLLTRLLWAGRAHKGQQVVAIAGMDAVAIPGLARDFAAGLFFDEGKHESGGPRSLVMPDADVEKIAKMLGVDTEGAWLDNQAGPLSGSYWDLHTREQLIALVKELGLGDEIGTENTKTAKTKTTKMACVKLLLAKRPGPNDKEVGLPLPKELRGKRKAESGKRKGG